MTKLRISPDLVIPGDVVTATTVVYGGKGMGKTNLGGVVVEELSKAGLRWALLDPMGVAWGLRHSKDGKGPGVSCLILGGAHGDIPIEPTGGAVVADLVVDEGANVIIDFSRHPDGKMWSNGERVRFVTDYAVRLFARQGSLVDGRRREPILQIIDEAARYIPQVIPSGAIDLAKCVGAWEQICEEGRNIGLGVMFLTQRSARMAKSVSELADVMFAFRTIGPNSLDAVLDWLGQHVEKSKVKDLSARVRELDVGQALVVSPGWLKVETIAKIRERETFDSSATPKAGQKPARVTGAAAKPDLDAYRARMAETIERAKANDPKALRAEVDRLRKELAKAGKAATPAADTKAIERAVARALADRDKKVAPVLLASHRFARALVEITTPAIVRDAQRLIASIDGIPDAPAADLPPMPRGSGEAPTMGKFTPAPPRPDPVRRDRGDSVRLPAGDSSLPPGERKILTAAAQNGGVDREQLSVLTGYKKTSRDVYIRRLTAKGFLQVDGNRITTTDAGVEALGDYEQLPAGDDLLRYWLDRLPEGEKKILSLVAAIHPRSIDRESIDAGYMKTSRDVYLRRLAARKLVTFPTRGEVRAADILFD